MKITVSRQELTAALIFTSKDESRFTLNGVQIEASKKFKPKLISTDGRRLTVIQTLAEQEQEFESDHSFILHPHIVKLFCQISKVCGGKLLPWITIENEPGSKKVVASVVGANSVFKIEDGALIEGEYPNWRKVVPSDDAPRKLIKDIALNAEFIGDYAKAIKALEGETNAIAMNLIGNDKQIEVKISDLENFYSLVMPCKLTEEDRNYQPEFLEITKSFASKEATAIEIATAA